MEDSDKQSVDLWTVLQDYLKYIKHDRTRVSLEDYVAASKAHRDSFVNAILHGGAGYLTIVIGLLSGLCELAKAIAIPLAPKFCQGLTCTSGWNAYTKTGPLVMAFMGISVLVIFSIFQFIGIEKYKARRSLPAKFPSYGCSLANVTISCLFATILMSVSIHLFILDLKMTWPHCLLSIAICTIRTSSVLPISIQVRKRQKNLILPLRILIALLLPFLLGCLLYVSPFSPRTVDSGYSTVVLELQLPFLLFWLGLVGSSEISIWKNGKRKKSDSIRSSKDAQNDLRTPEEWFVRALGYDVFIFCSLFCLLIVAVAGAAPLFVLIDTIPSL